MTWRDERLEQHSVDFSRWVGRNEWSVVYAVAYIQSDGEKKGLVLKVGSDDPARVYLNGELVYEYLGSRSYIADEDEVPGVRLKAGINVLVFKLVNTEDFSFCGWRGSVRLSDASGQPLKGIRVTLDPEGKDLL